MDNLKDAAIEKLYREAFPFVAKTIARLGGDLDAAKDIFHDALIIYIEKQRGETTNEPLSPAAYITGIARILWIRNFNMESRVISIEGKEAHISAVQDIYPLEEPWTAELVTYLESAGKKCLELLQAFYYEQQSMQEIAERFNYKTRHSATVQKHKCIEKVREQIKTAAIYEKAIA